MFFTWLQIRKTLHFYIIYFCMQTAHPKNHSNRLWKHDKTKRTSGWKSIDSRIVLKINLANESFYKGYMFTNHSLVSPILWKYRKKYISLIAKNLIINQADKKTYIHCTKKQNILFLWNCKTSKIRIQENQDTKICKKFQLCLA